MNFRNLTSIFYLLFAIYLLISCKKEYERPDEFAIDLFENEQVKDNPKELLSTKQANELSELILVIDSIKLLDSSEKENRSPIYIYQISKGKIDKKNKDSITFPLNILSTRKLNITSNQQYLYLEELKNFKLLVKDFNIKYQILERSPIE